MLDGRILELVLKDSYGKKEKKNTRDIHKHLYIDNCSVTV